MSSDRVEGLRRALDQMPDGRMPAPGGWNRIRLEVGDLASTVETLRTAGAHFRNVIVTGYGGKQQNDGNRFR